MNLTLPLEQMTIAEKMRTMENIWDDLCKKADGLPSPAWHKQVLKEREDRIKSGVSKFVDWEDAKKNIRKSIS